MIEKNLKELEKLHLFSSSFYLWEEKDYRRSIIGYLVLACYL